MRAPFRLSDRQAQAVLDMQLRRLARLERQKIEDEFAEIIKQIAYLEDLLANPRKVDFVIKEETLELKKKHGDDRRTQISERAVADFREEDLIPHQETVITISTRGYIKRIPLENYRAQRRGGRGKIGAPHREGDAVRHVRVADTHDNLLFFTDRGKVYQMRTHELPEESRQARGIPIINLIYLEQGEQVTAVVVARGGEQEYLVLATEKGEVKRTALSEYASVRRNGLITMDLEPGDALVAARLARDQDQAILVTARGQALRFPVSQLRAASRQSGGVRGIRLIKGDQVVGMDTASPGGQLLVVTRQRLRQAHTGGGVSHPQSGRAGRPDLQAQRQDGAAGGCPHGGAASGADDHIAQRDSAADAGGQHRQPGTGHHGRHAHGHRPRRQRGLHHHHRPVEPAGRRAAGRRWRQTRRPPGAKAPAAGKRPPPASQRSAHPIRLRRRRSQPPAGEGQPSLSRRPPRRRDPALTERQSALERGGPDDEGFPG